MEPEKTKAGKEPGTERRILEAAAKVFMLKGRLGASMQDIADEAGINRTLLHYYFRNKDKLFDTIFDKLIQELMPAMIEALSMDRPFFEKAGKFVEAFTNLLKENPYLPVFIFQEISINPERLAGMMQHVGIRPQETLQPIKEEMAQLGIHDMDPRHIFANMMGMVIFPYISRPLFQMIAFQNNENDYDQLCEHERFSS